MLKILILLILTSTQLCAQTPKIINGTPASTQMYPWIVNYKRCGGSLIAPQWVLTAAHCFGSFDTEELADIVIRSDNIKDLAPNAIRVKPIQIIPHPFFYNMDSDLALLKLEEPVNDVPVAILRSEPHLADDTKIIALGWGATGSDAQGESINFSDTLLETRLAVKNNGFCAGFFGSIITDNMLCLSALTDQERSDTCQGDSGGPIVMEGNGSFVQIGLTSFGAKPCGIPGVPAAYTRISQFKDWIRQFVPEAKFDDGSSPGFPAACQTTLDDNLNVDIPCAIMNNQSYHLRLTNSGKQPLSWQINNYTTSNCPVNLRFCTTVYKDLTLDIRKASDGKHTYHALLSPVPESNGSTWNYQSHTEE